MEFYRIYLESTDNEYWKWNLESSYRYVTVLLGRLNKLRGVGDSSTLSLAVF